MSEQLAAQRFEVAVNRARADSSCNDLDDRRMSAM